MRVRKPASLDHFVGEREQLVREGKAERSGGLEVGGQIELDRRLHRQVARLLALEDGGQSPLGPTRAGRFSFGNWPLLRTGPLTARGKPTTRVTRIRWLATSHRFLDASQPSSPRHCILA